MSKIEQLSKMDLQTIHDFCKVLIRVESTVSLCGKQQTILLYTIHCSSGVNGYEA